MNTIQNLRELKEIQGERDTIVQELLACHTRTEGGYSVNGISNVHNVMRNETILGYELMITEGFEKKYDDLRYAFPSGPSPLKDPALDQAVENLLGRETATFNDCVKALEENLHQIEQIELRQFHVHMILNATPDMDFNPVRLSVGDAVVQIRLIPALSPEFGKPEVIKDIRRIQQAVGFQIISGNRLVLSVSIEARNEFYAKKIAEELKDFTLGLIDISNHYASNPVTIIGVPSPIDTIDAILIFILDETGDYHGAYYTDEKPKDSSCSIRAEHLTETVRKYSNAPEDVQIILRQGFSAYHHGIIEKRPAFAFMYFWSGLEIILLKKKRLDHHSMLNRFFRLLMEQKSIHEFELDQLLGLRNQLMHEAAYHLIGQYQRNMLKGYVESALEFFLFNLSHLTRSQIELFYKQFDCSPSEFKRKHSPEDIIVFDLIKKLREQKPSEATR